MTSAYQQQLAQQLRDAETELGHRRCQVAELADELTATRASVIRHRTAWWSACRRATNYRTARERAEQAEARIAAVRALHQPDGRQLGTRNDGTYGLVAPACAACGAEGMATQWPCPTIAALDGVPEVQP